jgi:hypothetical protein
MNVFFKFLQLPPEGLGEVIYLQSAGHPFPRALEAILGDGDANQACS